MPTDRVGGACPAWPLVLAPLLREGPHRPELPFVHGPPRDGRRRREDGRHLRPIHGCGERGEASTGGEGGL